MVMCFICNHYSERETCKFFLFPKDPVERKRWIQLIRRVDREPSQYSLVCSCHFVDGERKNGPTILSINRPVNQNIINRQDQFNSQHYLCPSTGVLRSAATGLEVKTETCDPSTAFPIRVKPPAVWKTINDSKFSLSSAPVTRNTLDMDIKKEPAMQQKEMGALDLDRISEKELIRLIESDSPLLTAEEMIFNRKKMYRNRRRYIGDLSIDDFGTPAGKMFYLAAKKRADSYKTKIKTSMQKRNRLRNKLGKFNSMFKVLEGTCDVSEAKKILKGKEMNDYSCESSSSKEDDESDIEPVIMNPLTKIDQVHFAAYEKQETRINHFDFSNRVQVKFLPEGDSQMINALKIEINKLSHADISKSKRIDELYNVIFKKNKIIEDIQRQIEELKKTGVTEA